MHIEDGDIHVFTFKTGVLSKVAHDLRIRVGKFELSLDEKRLTGVFDLTSLVVEGAMTDRGLDAGVLLSSDRRKIEKTIQSEVLQTRRHHEARFDGVVTTDGATHIARGRLILRGRQSDVAIQGHESEGRISGSAELSPSRWGIAPYKALLGAIQLQDRVVVQFDLPIAGQDRQP